jgi:N-acetylglucosamine-6-sulfatase
MAVTLLAVTLLLTLLPHRAAGAPVKRPNIVWFVTDDQDQLLGGSFPQLGNVGPMPQTKKLMQAGGAMATNFFIHTPICCPSRSELL